MRKVFSVFALVTAGTTGCGDKRTGPVQVTPEMEAQQVQAEKDVRNAEAAMHKQQKPTKTPEQAVQDAEAARMRGR